jgi:microcystin-dependent protein
MDAFTGTILMWPLGWAPYGWMLCQGQVLPVNGNAALYSLIGTTYGGDGVNTFALPNLTARFPLAAGTGVVNGQSITFPLGLTGGKGLVANHTHVAVVTDPGHQHGVTVPAHTHPFAVPCNNATTSPTGTSPVNAYLSNTNGITDAINTAASSGGGNVGTTGLYSSTANGSMGSGTTGSSSSVVGNTGSAVTGVSVQIAPTGATSALDSLPPFIIVNYIICVNGIYPTRP